MGGGLGGVPRFPWILPGAPGRPLYVFGPGELDVEISKNGKMFSFLTVPAGSTFEYMLARAQDGCGSPPEAPGHHSESSLRDMQIEILAQIMKCQWVHWDAPQNGQVEGECDWVPGSASSPHQPHQGRKKVMTNPLFRLSMSSRGIVGKLRMIFYHSFNLTLFIYPGIQKYAVDSLSKRDKCVNKRIVYNQWFRGPISL